MEVREVVVSYVSVFGFLHIVVIPLGVRIAEFPYWLSCLSLILCYLFSLLAVVWNNKVLRLILSAVFSIAWAYEWLQIYTWIPPWTDMMYLVMSLLDLVQAVFLVVLSMEVSE